MGAPPWRTWKSAPTAIAIMGTIILSTANTRATGRCIWTSGGATEVGGGDCVATATANNVEIRRGPFVISPQVNGACSYSEGGRQHVRKEGMNYAMKKGKGGLLLLPLKLLGSGGHLLPRSFFARTKKKQT